MLYSRSLLALSFLIHFLHEAGQRSFLITFNKTGKNKTQVNLQLDIPLIISNETSYFVCREF